MIDMSVILETSELSERAINQVVKVAGSLTMQEHRGRIPGHFEFSAFAKYGYKPRSKRYQLMKARKYKTTAPLVRSGALRAAILRNAKVTATGNKAELRSKGEKTSQLMSQYRIELESYTSEEERQNAESFRDKFIIISSDPSLRRKRRQKV
jgi:chorismate synthase